MPVLNKFTDTVKENDVNSKLNRPFREETPAALSQSMTIDESTIPKKPRRIHFIDEVRGFSILIMVIYHALFVIGWLLHISWGQGVYLFFNPLQDFFDAVFIFICGISCHLSHSNWKRGGMLALIALGITVTLWFFMPDEIILYGILHFLATAILLFALLRPLLSKISPIAGIALCFVLFWLTYWVPAYHGSVFGIEGLFEWPVPSILTQQTWLYPIGFGYVPCADYFPVLPWIFCFFAGTFVGKWAKENRFPAWTYRRRVPFFSLVGKHTLLIYIVHMPVIYGIGLLCQYLVQLLS